MNSTWLSRKIKGPNAEGDPVKKKKDVKPYITYDPNDSRIQAYSDSLALYNSSNQSRVDNILSQGGWKYDTDNYTHKNYELTEKDKKSYLKENQKKLSGKKGLGYETQSGNDGIIDRASGGSSDTKAQKDLIHSHIAPVKAAPLVDTWMRSSKNISKNLPNPNYGKPYAKDKGGEVIRNFFNVPIYAKPKQEVIVRKKGVEKIPIGKLKSKSTTPRKLNNRKPSNVVYYDKPKKTSIATTGNPGSKTRYATVNKGDKRGTVYLTKSEYDKEIKNIFIK